ncbi:hypothetical protein PGT21_008713 [Puccinia graminis f. sp. tritici]|uniref:Uncharacterized protein n=1 Tax=Puccinia graminis f. sp. tritici TaxID=56615 RepID=A0A5B0RJK9_PUCGR|nr:hypothetical protein PGT21_008713 [Puccinia graminis f. sp. tritici]KAA1124914.1 hypothetical protein PGTUg99_036686 [Puccinia graminis f. sp. tritici]
MVKKRTKRAVPVSRAVRLRREVNHERDLAALHSFRGVQNSMARMDVALSADTRLAEDLVNEHSYNFDDNQDQPNQNDDEEESDDGWVPIDIEPPDEYDVAIESNIERLRQEAVRCENSFGMDGSPARGK